MTINFIKLDLSISHYLSKVMKINKTSGEFVSVDEIMVPYTMEDMVTNNSTGNVSEV